MSGEWEQYPTATGMQWRQVDPSVNVEPHQPLQPDRPVGSALLDDLERWFGRFICVSFEGDLALLALWAAHTHLVNELRTTPRLQIDSPMPNSGKTTVLDHFSRLCHRPIQIASPPSQALIPRILEYETRTILLDEVDRILRPESPSTPDLLAITNSGYRVGATRPVLEPTKGGGWRAVEMSTFCALAMAGNAPVLPDDTRSRIIRVLLMPDFDGSVEDSDWEYIEDDAIALRERLAEFAADVREAVQGMAVDLPRGCIGRSKEKWRPLKRVAVVAGGRWPAVADALIVRDMDEEAAEREAGLKARPPGVVACWPTCPRSGRRTKCSPPPVTSWPGSSITTPTTGVRTARMASN
jgi:hypothetical protein